MKYTVTLLLLITILFAKEMPQQHNQVLCTAKSQLPIEVTLNGKPQASSAQIKVKFLKAFSDVSIKVTGLDGLSNVTVIQDNQHLTVASNTQRTFDLSYSAPEGRSYFSVEITVVNGKKTTSMVKAFQVGQMTSSQNKAAHQNTLTDHEGNRIIIMPATQQ